MQKKKYLENENLSIVLFLFVFIMYAVIYMTKCMFSSAMAIIVEEGFMTKSQTGLINAVFWFVYGVFQIFGGIAVDRYSPSKMIMIGFIGAAISNIIIFFNQSYYVMMGAWVFNAIVQFGVWPGVFKLVSTQLAPAVRGRASFWLLFSSNVGLGISMLTASFVDHWKDNFLVSAVSLLIIVALFAVINSFMEKRMVIDESGTSENVDRNTENDKHPIMPLMMSSGLIVFMVVCLLRTAADNGIKMMTPVMLMESYDNLPGAISTRLSTILIVFSATGTFVAGFIQKKITSNEAKAQIILYSLSLLPLLVVCFVGRVHYLYVLLTLCLSALTIYGAAPFSMTFLAVRFGKYDRIGTVSGILNATASVGNVMASYVFARMAEVMSWTGVAITWLSAVVVCLLLCALVYPAWTRFINE